ncbi:Avirulence protein, partial [Globisporangium splendens]
MEAAVRRDAALEEMPLAFDLDVAMDAQLLYAEDEDKSQPSTLKESMQNDDDDGDMTRARSASEAMSSPCSENGIRVNMEISPTRRIKAKTKKETPKQVKKKTTAGAATGNGQDGEHEQAEDDTVAKRKQASIDQRRKRNREAMQRARQRDKEYMDGLRDTAHALEEKHNELLEKVNAQLAVFTNSGHSDSRIAELQDRLQQARDQAEALKRQNLEFLEEIGDRIKREDRMEGLFRELMREQEVQEEMLNEIFRESITETQLGVFFTEERAMRVIINSRNDKSQVERQGFDNTPVGDLFGWSTQYRFEGKIFYFSFTKTFRNRRAVDVMERN